MITTQGHPITYIQPIELNVESVTRSTENPRVGGSKAVSAAQTAERRPQGTNSP